MKRRMDPAELRITAALEEQAAITARLNGHRTAAIHFEKAAARHAKQAARAERRGGGDRG